MAGKEKGIAGAIEAGALSMERKPQYRRTCVFVGLALTVLTWNLSFQTYEVIKMVLLTRKQRVIVAWFPVSLVFFQSPYFASTTEFQFPLYLKG